MKSFIDLTGGRRNTLRNRLKETLPEGGNLNLCLTCGACSAGCPAAGLEGMDPRKFVRLIALGMEDEVVSTPWVWMCTMCQRCVHSCPMKVNIPEMVYRVREMWPREKRPKGILGSCDLALKNESSSAMGIPVEDWKFVVEDVLAEVQAKQPGWENLRAPLDKEGAFFCLNQNSREPVMEPEEMVPLWKILHTAGADWTYPSKGWAGENYCMFLADEGAWEHVVRNTAEQVDRLGSKVLLNTE
jgi:Fe-S oxidoreductase